MSKQSLSGLLFHIKRYKWSGRGQVFIEWGGGYCLYYLGEGQVFIEWGVIVYSRC